MKTILTLFVIALAAALIGGGCSSIREPENPISLKPTYGLPAASDYIMQIDHEEESRFTAGSSFAITGMSTPSSRQNDREHAPKYASDFSYGAHITFKPIYGGAVRLVKVKGRYKRKSGNNRKGDGDGTYERWVKNKGNIYYKREEGELNLSSFKHQQPIVLTGMNSMPSKPMSAKSRWSIVVDSRTLSNWFYDSAGTDFPSESNAQMEMNFLGLVDLKGRECAVIKVSLAGEGETKKGGKYNVRGDGMVYRDLATGVHLKGHIKIQSTYRSYGIFSGNITESFDTTFNLLSGQPQSSFVNGLSAYYPFNGNAKDESGYGSDGVVNGATLSVDRHGKNNAAFTFKKGDSIRISNMVMGADDQLTLALWVKAPAANEGSTWPHLVGGNTRNNLSRNTAIFLLGGTRQLELEVDTITGSPGRYQKTGSRKVPIDRWFHALLTYNGKQMTEYIDGNEGKSWPVSGKLSPLSICSIGHSYKTFQFEGAIDDVRIYNRALSAVEVKALYDLEKPKAK